MKSVFYYGIIFAMNDRALRTLEFYKILDALTAKAGSAGGKELAAAARPLNDPQEIRLQLEETTAAKARLSGCGNLGFSGIRDVRASAKRLDVGSALGIVELLNVSRLLDTASRAKAYDRHPNAPEEDALTPYFAQVEPLTPLNQEIKRCIISEEEISDDASPALRQIRRGMARINDRIHSELNSLLLSSRTYLQDAVITMRDGRYCIPVKAEHKANVSGIVHDQSGSGSTFFIEPMAVVRLNNEFKELEIREQKEIEAILADLSNQAAAYSHELVQDYNVLTRLDYIFAKAYLSVEMRGNAPDINTDRVIDLKKARHPLIPPHAVVPVNVWLGRDFDMLIITGPNTGGKTVTLKTIGLLTLMALSGLHVPAEEGSAIGVFEEVYSDIGDEQSIEQSLSTFSSHMTNIVDIIDHVTDRDLVLFDELGAGTDPVEGAALAMSILQHLLSLDIRSAATTHYSELKLFALSTPGVENASCEFDVATLKPTYRLLIGIPGKSNAFAISGKLGLPEDIITQAQELIGAQDEAFEDVISELEEKRVKLEREEARARELRSEIERLRNELATEQEKLAERRNAILGKARDEAREIIQNAKDTADKAIRQMNKAGMTAGKEAEAIRSGLREELNKLGAETEQKERKAGKKPEKLHIGDAVHVVSLNLNGTVSTLPNEKGNLTVRMGILHSEVNIADLELIEEETSPDGKSRVTGGGSIRMSKAMTIKPEINLVGKRVDEAMPELEKYLDDAYLSHLPSVRIIHGRGTGALRDAVRSMLKKNKHVKSWRQGEFNEGGYGVTVAEFK